MRVKIIRFDNWSEYFYGALCSYVREHGIIHQTTCVNTPQQNSVAERKKKSSFT